MISVFEVPSLVTTDVIIDITGLLETGAEVLLLEEVLVEDWLEGGVELDVVELRGVTLGVTLGGVTLGGGVLGVAVALEELGAACWTEELALPPLPLPPPPPPLLPPLSVPPPGLPAGNSHWREDKWNLLVLVTQQPGFGRLVSQQ